MPSFNIRQATISDLPYVYDICLLTGDSSQDASPKLSDRFIPGQYFAAPYLLFELDACFVLENHGVPVGYVIGVCSTYDFCDWMNKTWLPSIRPYYPQGMPIKSSLEKFFFDLIHENYRLPPKSMNDYPSHLHIDILPVGQKQGFGKKLIMTFLSRLKQKGSKGVHLGVGTQNTNAIAFYRHLGFEQLGVTNGAIWMGMKL